MADREYKIRITTIADNAGVQQTVQGLQQVKAEITDSMNPALLSMSDSHKAAAKSAEENELSHKALKLGLKTIGPEAVEAAHAIITGMANPVTAAFVGMTFLVGQYVEEWQKMREAVAAQPDTSGMEKITKALGRDGMLQVMTDAEVALADYLDGVRRLAKEEETLAQKTDAAVAAMKKQADAEGKQMGEKEKAELAKIEALRKSGAITDEEARSRSEGVKNNFAGDAAVAAQMAQEAEIRKRKEELDTVNKRKQSNLEGVIDSDTKATNAAGEIKSLTDQMNGARARQEANEKQVKENRDAILLNDARRARGADTDPSLKPMALYQKEIAHDLNEFITIRDVKLPAAQESANRANRDAAEAKKKQADDDALAKKLGMDIPVLEADLTRDNATRAREAKTRAQLATFGGGLAGTAAGDIEAAERTAQAIRNKRLLDDGTDPDQSRKHRDEVNAGYRQATSKASRDQLIDTASATAGHQVDFNTAIAMMDKAAGDKDVEATMIGRLISAMEKMIKHQTSPQLQGRVATIEAQVAQLIANANNAHH